MERTEPNYLIPVTIKERKIGDSTLNIEKLNDITFEKFYDSFFNRLGKFRDSWKWLHARTDAVGARALSNLLGFCSVPEKIRATQEMYYVLMHSLRFCEFILDPTAPYDKWADNNHGDNGIEMLKAFSAIVTALDEKFQAFPENGKHAIEPFITYVSELQKGQLMKDVREFILLFEKPLEITFFIAEYNEYSHHSFNNFTSMYYQYCNNPEGSYQKTEKMRYGIDGLEAVAYFFDGEKKIAIEEYSYMQGMEEDKEPCAFIHIPKSFIVQVLELGYKDFLSSFMPQYYEPLVMTLRIENKNNGYKIFYTISEPGEDVVLEYVKEEKKTNGRQGYSPSKMISRPRKATDKQKGERTEVQKLLLGKTKTFITNNDFVYKTKVRYFSFFFEKCRSFMHDDFGYKLGELRYLAYVANELRFIGMSTKLIFPTILPVENNSALIVDGINPSLFLDSENKKQVVKNTIKFNNESRITIISGPNQNGKSRYMDMIGLCHIIFQAGWPIMAEEAEISPKTDLRVHYVHSGVGIIGESRFSNECLQLHHEFNYAEGDYPLFLIDEPYTGTNYIDAETLLKEVLLACSEEQTTIFLTTHFHGLIEFVDSLPNGLNLHCVVKDDNSFTYTIREGGSTKSNALEVADKARVRYEHIKSILKGNKDKEEKAKKNILFSSDFSEEDDLPF